MRVVHDPLLAEVRKSKYSIAWQQVSYTLNRRRAASEMGQNILQVPSRLSRHARSMSAHEAAAESEVISLPH